MVLYTQKINGTIKGLFSMNKYGPKNIHIWFWITCLTSEYLAHVSSEKNVNDIVNNPVAIHTTVIIYQDYLNTLIKFYNSENPDKTVELINQIITTTPKLNRTKLYNNLW